METPRDATRARTLLAQFVGRVVEDVIGGQMLITRSARGQEIFFQGAPDC